MRGRLRPRNGWPTLVGCLLLPVADQSQLNVQSTLHLEHLRYRVVEVNILARMNLCALLRAVKFVHLEGGNNGRFSTGQVKGLPRRGNVSPIPGTDVVIRGGVESAGG